MKKIAISVEEKVIGHTCSMDKHLVDLYQASKKRKRKIETNLVDNSNPEDLAHLDVFYFFQNTEWKNNHYIGDENIHINLILVIVP